MIRTRIDSSFVLAHGSALSAPRAASFSTKCEAPCASVVLPTQSGRSPCHSALTQGICLARNVCSPNTATRCGARGAVGSVSGK